MKTVYFKDVWWIKSFLYFISEILDFISSGCIVFLSTASTYGCLKKFARCTNTFSRYTERSILVACDPCIVCTKVRLHLLPNLQKIQTNKKKIRSNELTIKLSNLTCRPQIPFSLDSTACLVPLESHQMWPCRQARCPRAHSVVQTTICHRDSHTSPWLATWYRAF